LIYETYPVYDEALLCIKELQSLWGQIGDVYNNLSGCFEKLSKSFGGVKFPSPEEFGDAPQVPEMWPFEHNTDCYSKSSKVFSQLGTVYNEQSKGCFTSLNQMLNYSKKETESVQSLFNLWTSYSNEYRVKNNELLKKKEVLFAKPDIVKWK
jgi:hypothetical protein